MVKIIELRDLTKYYGNTLGIDGLDLVVNQGEVFGYLGPNGAGKTTTIRLLLDLIRPTRGECLINGYNCNTQSHQANKDLEYLPGDFVAYRRLTCNQYLKFMAGFYNGHETEETGKELAEYFNLDLSRKVGDCSHGMKQKLGLIQTFMVDCSLYILDEPTTGLDPLIQQKFYELIEDQKKKGKTIFLSSHILNEVERICDRVAIIRNGKLIEVDSVDNIKNKKFKKVKVSYKVDVPEGFFDRKGMEIKSQRDLETVVRITSDLGKNLHHLTSKPVRDIKVMDPSLEEVFLSFYGSDE